MALRGDVRWGQIGEWSGVGRREAGASVAAVDRLRRSYRAGEAAWVGGLRCRGC